MASKAATDGLGINTAATDAALPVQMLVHLAQFCEALMKEAKASKTAIESLRQLAEAVGHTGLVAGAVTRHIKHNTGQKRLLCWYLVDALAKAHPETFGMEFGPSIQILASEHMGWTEGAKLEGLYTKLVESWRNLFGANRCDEILRAKETRKAEHELAEREKAEAKARGETDEQIEKSKKEKEVQQKWDLKDLMVGVVDDQGVVKERVTPCYAYLIGKCTSSTCSQPHPPGMFGKLSVVTIYGDWVCLSCGYRNEAKNDKCWRHRCAGKKPAFAPVAKQDMMEDELVKRLGYDPGAQDENDADGCERAVEHYKDQSWPAWRAARKRNLLAILRSKAPVPPAAAPAAAAAGAPRLGCQQCHAPLKPGALFCTECGAKQVAEPPVSAPAPAQAHADEAEPEDLLFPSARLTVQDAPSQMMSSSVTSLLAVCENILTSRDPALLDEFLSLLQLCAQDPTYLQLPQHRAQVILRALSCAYSRWAAAKSPGHPALRFLCDLSAMRSVLPLQPDDQEVFEKITAEAAESKSMAPPTAPAAGATISL